MVLASRLGQHVRAAGAVVKSTKEVALRLPVALHAKLKERSEQDDRSMAATVRVALREYIDGEGLS